MEKTLIQFFFVLDLTDVLMIFKMKTLLLFFVLYMFMNFDTVIAKKRTRRRNRHFCPSLQGKKRPAVLNVEASLELAQVSTSVEFLKNKNDIGIFELYIDKIPIL